MNQCLSDFHKRDFRVHRNPARPSDITETGTHGGEILYCKTYFKITPIDDMLYEIIAQHNHEPCSFCAMFARLEGVTIL